MALFALERGPADGPTLVLLHHFGGSGQQWLPVISRLESRFRCVAPDLRGFGRSRPGARPTVEAMADDLAVLTGRLPRFTLVGHSMGGKVALEFAARRPAGLERLVLVAPSPPTPEPIADTERARLLASYGSRTEALRTNRRIVARPLDESRLESLVADNLRASRQAWFGWLEVGSRQDLSLRAALVSVPVLVLAGERDPVLPPALLEREVVGRLEGARFVVAPGAGHLLPLEAPDAVCGAICGEGAVP